MSDPGKLLPPEIVDAIRRGSMLEAIRLLRKSGINLKDAKGILEAHRDQMMGVHGGGGKPGHPAAPMPPQATSQAAFHPMMSLPPNVVEALKNGSKLQAIALLRQQTGLGLKEAKEAVEHHERGVGAVLGGLSPGQVGSAGGTAWSWIVVALIAGAIYFYFR